MNNALSLIINDGKADKLIFGGDFLRRRIRETVDKRKAQGVPEADQYPSVAEVARTHMVLTHSSYKLHVACASEYFKLIPSSSQGILQEGTRDQEISFRIQNNTEYVSDCVLDVDIGEINNGRRYALDSAKVAVPVWQVVDHATGAVLFTVTGAESLSNATAGSQDIARAALLMDLFTSDQLAAIVKHSGVAVELLPWTAAVETAALTLRGDPAGTQVYDGSVALNIRGNAGEMPDSAALDIVISYDHAYVKDGQYVVVDQELPADLAPYGRWFDFPGHRLVRESVFSIAGTEMSKYTSDDYSVMEKTRLRDDKRDSYHLCVGQAVRKTAKGEVCADVQLQQDVLDGPQVPRPFPLPAQRFYIPTLHWFSKLEHSLPVGNLAAQTIELKFKLSGLADLIKIVPAPIQKVRMVRTLLGGTPEYPEEEVVTEAITMDAYKETGMTGQGLSTNNTNCVVYSCGITVAPDFAEVLAKKTHFQLIRLIKSQVVGINKAIDTQLQLNDLRLPTEYFVVGARPTDVATKSHPDLWHRFNYATVDTLERRLHVGVGRQAVDRSLQLVRERNMFTRFGCKAYSNEFFKRGDLMPRFYNAYLPFVRGGEEFPSFKDAGLMFLPFALLPGKHQPSGHLNLNRTNLTFNFEYESDMIGSLIPNAELFVSTSVINFLLVVGHAAVLRFH